MSLSQFVLDDESRDMLLEGDSQLYQMNLQTSHWN